MTRNYCIELDGKTFVLAGSRLEMENDFQSAEDCSFLVADFERSVSRVMHVDADVKYAEALVARALQEEGEFDEPVTVLTHWKKTLGRKSTDIFFTALPTRQYLKYMGGIAGHEDLLFLVPVFSVMANLIHKIASEAPVAVVFRHDRFAELVIGEKNKFYYASQCVGFDTSEEQTAALWQTVSREISQTEQQSAIQVKRLISLNWIDSQEELPPLPDFEIDHLRFDEKAVVHEQLTHEISFPSALDLFPPLEGIAPQQGKLFYAANRISPLIMVFFIFAIAVNAWMAYSFQSKTQDMQASLNAYENRLYRIKKDLPPLPDLIDPLETLRFADKIFHNRLMLSYSDIITDISNGAGGITILDQVRAEYKEKKIQIKLNGHFKSGFKDAYKAYQNLLSILETRGYQVGSSQFDTGIDSCEFELSLLWSLK